MKKNIIIPTLILLAINLNSQSINLKIGEEFTYHTSEYFKKREVENFKESIKEGIDRGKILFSVTDSTDSSYVVNAKLKKLTFYQRKKDLESNTWTSQECFHNNLQQQNKNRKHYISYYYLKKISFHLTKMGKVSNIEILDSSNKEILQSKFEYSIDSTNYSLTAGEYYTNLLLTELEKIFYTTNASLNKNEIVKLNNSDYKVVEIKNNIATLTAQSTNPSDHYQKLHFNATKGLFTNNQQYYHNPSYPKLRSGQSGYPHSYKYESLRNQSLVFNNNTPYNCKIRLNSKVLNSTFEKTNVTIKGYFKGFERDSLFKLYWDEHIPAGYNRHQIITKIDSNNYFELRFHLDKMKRFYFYNNFYIPVYFKPGDDLFVNITIDTNSFSTEIEGISSDEKKFILNNYLPINDKNLKNLDFYSRNTRLESKLPPNEFKKHFIDLLNENLNHLNSNKHLLTPELYLAEYYYNVTNLIETLNIYPRYQKMFRERDGKKPFIINENSYYDYDTIIHADNNLMAFSNDYQHFIKEYVFFHLDKKIRRMAGKGNLVYADDFYDFTYQSQYNVAHYYYTGKAKEALKYSSVSSALQRAEWPTAKSLVEKFRSEYPNSTYIEKLNISYERVKKVSVGQPAPEIALKNFDGNLMKINDFKGNALYIDLFTTSRASYYNRDLDDRLKIQEMFKDTNVVFLNIVPKRKVKWAKKKFQEDGIAGVNLIASKEEEAQLRETFLMNSIRDFYIFDIDGYISYRNGPEPYRIVRNPDYMYDALRSSHLPEKDNQKQIRLLKISVSILVILLIVFIVIWFVYKRISTRKLRLANLNSKVRELELTAIRAQMNPHFMYNCLNSIQNLVQKGKNDEAHQYISKFATLIRAVLKNSDKEEITLHEEMEMLQSYISLEQLRFTFEFNQNTESSIDLFSVFVPPLLLQPIVENAIIHGLANKKGPKNLSISIRKMKEKICISIVDNGIGINSSDSEPSNNTGKGLKFSRERLKLMADKYKNQYSLSISDLSNKSIAESGTKVEICFAEE